MKDVKSMKNTEIAEKVKSAIIKDLFADVDTQKCAIDIFLQNPKTFEKTANTLNKESISFLNKCHQQLKAESDNGNILFFRKYIFFLIFTAKWREKMCVESLRIVHFKREGDGCGREVEGI